MCSRMSSYHILFICVCNNFDFVFHVILYRLYNGINLVHLLYQEDSNSIVYFLYKFN